ncbi:hypothetical protein ACOMHN_017915 [Nucella lapillus]
MRRSVAWGLPWAVVGALLFCLTFMGASAELPSSSPDTPPSWVCPALCTCSKSGESVNCDGKRLTTVPKGIPPVVQTLYLDHNNIVILGENALANLTHLTKVYMRNGQLQTIRAGAFRNLPLLKELYLTNNRIANIPPEAFQSVATLSLLSLQHNTMTSIPDLPSLPGLKKLYLEANQIRDATFPAGYANLKLLNAVGLSNNNISLLTNDTFAMLNNSDMRRLEIARNRLTNVSSGALKPLKMLQSLKIGWNPLDSHQLQHVLEGLRDDTNLESLDIRSIRLGETLPSFSILSGTPLRSLILNHNIVSKIQERAFSHLPKLVFLDLSACHVREVADHAFMDLPDLQNLFLNYNQDLTTVPRNLPANLWRLYLQGNGMSVLQDGVLKNLTQLRELYLSDNKIHEVAENSFVGLMSLRILHLQNNGLSYIPKKLFSPLTNLQTLLLKNNNLRSFKPNPGAMTSLAALTLLDMSENQCNYIPFDLFAELTSLQTLSLNDNDLGGLMAADSSGRLLGHMTKLQKLNLASNNLHYIHDAQFRNLYDLHHLNLRNNRLSTWGLNLFYTPGTAKKSLKTLDLSINQIALVNKTSVRDLQHLKMLNLTSNPFACTCDLRWFRTWLNNTTVGVVNKTLYKCNSPAAWNGRSLLEFGPDKIDCTNRMWYYIGSAIGATFLAATIIFSFAYNRRWFIRFRLLRLQRALSGSCCGGTRERQGGYEQIEGQNVAGKEFDFYVICAEEDTTWVMDNLLPALDNQRNMRDPEQRYPGKFSLYFEERDMIVGKTKVHNFDRFMRTCRAALVVLTPHLKGDTWGLFLLEQAYHMKIDGEIEQIHIIMVGSVPPRHVPARLHKAIRDNQYREWLTRDNREQEFVFYLEHHLQRGQGQGQGQGYEAVADPDV